ncbi:MAG: UDP-N-acetyl-D-mannosamine dehydrogenase [Legionellaceae bacterium]|nr:UDP-N-acetyl-D-mannosamine dehydrogenase [Legionellaceae bacterium]
MPHTVSVIGLGYIGLPTAALIASRKHAVIGVDINTETVNTVNSGEIHIVEPDLDILVHATVSEGYLRATLEPEEADVFLIAVPTPLDEEKQPDLSYIESAAKAIAPVLKKNDLVILESTSPVGTTEKMAEWLALERGDLSFPHQMGEASDIRIAYCPERVLPGHVLRELVHNDRVIGGMTVRCSEVAQKFYSIFVEGDCITTTSRTAEMCKLTENSFRDVNIAFANELSMLCDEQNINVWELIRLANRHPRVNILQPGPGVGGHCIAVDPWFIISQHPEKSRLMRVAREVNDLKPEWVIEKLKNTITSYLSEHPQKQQKDITIACFGLTFKPDIDDLRESPALKIVEKISTFHRGPLLVVEPNIDKLPANIDRVVQLCAIDQALSEATIVLMLVDHNQFKAIALENYKAVLKLDLRSSQYR